MATFRGNAFELSVPDAWVDRTIYTFVGPTGEDATPWVRAVLDHSAAHSTLESFADRTIRAASTAAPGYRLLRRQSVTLADGSAALRAEVRWFPTSEIRLYQRTVYVLWGKSGVTVTSQLTKKTRLTQGPIVDRLMESLRRRVPPPGAPPPAPAGAAAPVSGLEVTADRFTLVLPAGWRDETVYMLAEPDESRFRRNLVIRREKAGPATASLAEFARAEVASLAASVPAFELVQEVPAASRDGGPTHRLVFRRAVESGGTVLQLQHVAPREGVLYWLSLTVEDGIGERDRAAFLEMLASFSAPAPPAQAIGLPLEAR